MIPLIRNTFFTMPRETYSQLGEDIVVDNLLAWMGLNPFGKGFYLDLGAYHPSEKSNTRFFYERNSRGINVDVGKEKKALFEYERPDDLFWETAVVPDDSYGKNVKFSFTGDYGAPDDFMIDAGDKHIRPEQNLEHRRIVQVKATTIHSLLKKAKSLRIWQESEWRILNVDIEGMDEEVIQNIDFAEFPFEILLVEDFIPKKSDWRNKIFHLINGPVYHSLFEQGYSLQHVCGPTLIFCRIQSKK